MYLLVVGQPQDSLDVGIGDPAREAGPAVGVDVHIDRCETEMVQHDSKRR